MTGKRHKPNEERLYSDGEVGVDVTGSGRKDSPFYDLFKHYFPSILNKIFVGIGRYIDRTGFGKWVNGVYGTYKRSISPEAELAYAEVPDDYRELLRYLYR